jgi:hypothetical protein
MLPMSRSNTQRSLADVAFDGADRRAKSIASVTTNCQIVHNNLLQLYYRLVTQLAIIATMVEGAVAKLKKKEGRAGETVARKSSSLTKKTPESEKRANKE